MAFFGIGFFFFVFVSNLRFERPPLLSLPLDLWQEKRATEKTVPRPRPPFAFISFFPAKKEKYKEMKPGRTALGNLWKCKPGPWRYGEILFLLFIFLASRLNCVCFRCGMRRAPITRVQKGRRSFFLGGEKDWVGGPIPNRFFLEKEEEDWHGRYWRRETE